MPDGRALAADAVHHLQIVGVRADDGSAAVLQDVAHLRGVEPEVDRHEHRADLRHAVERLQVGGGVRRDVGDAVSLADTELLERGRPAVAALEELRVGESAPAVDNGLAPAVQAARAAHELERRQSDIPSLLNGAAPQTPGKR